MSGSRALVTRSSLVLLVLLGAGLRVLGTGSQIVAGDEIHPLLSVARHTAAYAFTHFEPQDTCIPITLWCKLLQSTVGLEEWGFRLPAYVPGALLVLLAARASRGLLEPAERALFTLFVATSPLLVYWSREARPYSAITLFAALAVLALVRFARTGRRSSGIGAAASLAALIYFSPTTLPFVGGLALGALVCAPDLGAGASRARLVLPCVAGVTLAAALTAPALASLFEILESKRVPGAGVGAESLLESLRLATGLPAHEPGRMWRLAALLPAILALLGLVRIAAVRPRLGLGIALTLLTPAVVYALVPVAKIDLGHVYVRYQAAALPLAMLASVHGLQVLRGFAGRSTLMGRLLLGSAFLAAILSALLGPLASGLPHVQPFGLQSSSMNAVFLPEERARDGCLPAFYRDVGADDVIVEWPAREENRRLLATLRARHGARVVRCWPLGREPEGLRFRTLLFGFVSAALRAPDGAWIVVHRSPDRELAFVETCEGRPATRASLPAADACREIFGAPVHEDEWHVVFRVSREGNGE